MKAAAFVLAALVMTGPGYAVPAHAQFSEVMKKAQKAHDKIAEVDFTDYEERQLGEKISSRLVTDFGVYQDKDVAKYVTLVGSVLAKESSRPDLKWTFIVLDTDAVNAFAAPGGAIHVTRGLLGLAKNEAELAGVLAHEITHVADKHTIHAIQQGKLISMGTDAVGGGGSARDEMVAKFADKGYHLILDGEFSRGDEDKADEKGVRLANKLGYDPHGLAEVLTKLDARNAGRDDRNGLFASHPATKDRIANLQKQIAAEKLSGKATVQPRYAKNITFDAKPVTEIAVNSAGAAGLAGDASKPADKNADKGAKKEEEPKKKSGGLLGMFTTSSSDEKRSSQTVASAGARGVGSPDRDAKGGSNPARVVVTVSAAEVESFKKGIA